MNSHHPPAYAHGKGKCSTARGADGIGKRGLSMCALVSRHASTRTSTGYRRCTIIGPYPLGKVYGWRNKRMLVIPLGVQMRRVSSGSAALSIALGFTLVAGSAAALHTGDYAPADNKVSMPEVLRVIQLYNAGRIHCDSTTEDGYAIGNGDQTCLPHASDYAPQEWSISLSELLRFIQFFNAGGYRETCESEDSFLPGLGDTCGSTEGEPVPVIVDVLPRLVDPAGGTRLRITGKGIGAANEVLVGGMSAIRLQQLAADALLVTTPSLPPGKGVTVSAVLPGSTATWPGTLES